MDTGPSSETTKKYTVSKRTSMEYAWDYPAGRDKRLVLCTDRSRRAIDIMEIGDLVPFKFSVGRQLH